jgi:uncharacterized membrane protein
VERVTPAAPAAPGEAASRRGFRAGARWSHVRFYGALLAGLLVWVATRGQHPQLRILLAGDVFFALYVAEMLAFTVRATPQQLRDRVGGAPAAALATVCIAAAAVLLTLIAVFTLLNHPRADGRFFPIVAVASVPLSWAMVHTVAAFQYARLYWSPSGPGRARGLQLPGDEEPSAFDFLYHAFVIGMAFSVSDISTRSRSLRAATLIHGVISFTFNTVLIAIAFNAAMTFAG